MTDIETISKITEVLNATGSHAVSEYTSWYIASSFVWLMVGVVISVLATRWKAEEDWDFPPVVIKWFCVFVGLLFIGCNFPDLLSPKAMAIHQLIKDIRG